MEAPSFSVIIPVYNAEKYLLEAIESVLNQSLKPSEIIIVNDGSTDRSLEIAENYSRYAKIINQENKGAGAAKNKGIEQAKGQYLAFLDADDIWTKEKLNHQVSYLSNHPEIDMVFGKVDQFISPELLSDHQARLSVELKTMPAMVAGGMLIKKSDFLKVGYFIEQLQLGEFIDWFARAREIGFKFHIMDEIVLFRRIHLSNLGIQKRDHVKDYTSVLREALKRKQKNHE